VSLHTPNRSRSIKAARAQHRVDSDRSTTLADINEFKHMIRKERKDKARSRRKPSTKRPGSDEERAARELADRPTLPLNERQQALYDLLGPDPQRPVGLRKTLGLTGGQLGAAMGGLTIRGLAVKTPHGWRREDAA